MKNKIFCLLLFICVSACASTDTNPASPQLVHSTNTLISPIATPPKSSTLTSPSASVMTKWADQSCWEMKNNTDSPIDFPGSLVYLDPILNQNIILSLKNRKMEPVMERFVSPDGSLLADVDHETGNLRIASSIDNKNYSIPNDWYFFGKYLSDNSLLLSTSGSLYESYQVGKGATDQVIIFSPSNGEYVRRSYFLPDIYLHPGNHYFYIEYSPDFRYVIYPTDNQQDGSNSILFDLQDKKVLWRGSGEWGFPSYAPPIWRLDSKAVTVIDRDKNANVLNFYNISLDGSYIPITQFQNIFDSTTVLSYMSWSPDGRYLAFAVSSPKIMGSRTDELSILILDSHNGELINPCIALPYYSTDGIKWSPDSNNIAIVPHDRSRILIASVDEKILYEAYKLPGVDFVDPYSQSNLIVLQLFGWLSWELP